MAVDIRACAVPNVLTVPAVARGRGLDAGDRIQFGSASPVQLAMRRTATSPRHHTGPLAGIAAGGWQRLLSDGRLRPAQGRLQDLGPPMSLPPGIEAPSDLLARMRDE